MKKFLKYVYKNLPFKKTLFIALRNAIKLPHEVYKHLYFSGIFTVKVAPNQIFKLHHFGYQVENAIFWSGIFGYWEKESLSLWDKLAARSQYIVDVGANTGIYALLAKSRNPNAHVIALEPVERVYKRLVANVDLNDYEIACVRKAASNYTGTATIYDLPVDHTYSVTVNKNTAAIPQKAFPVEIETITLDELLPSMGMSSVDLIKIDVETHEREVLEGLQKIIAESKPTMLIEILNPEVATGVQELVENFGYLYFSIDEATGITKRSKITPFDSYNYLLCTNAIAQDLGLT